MSGPTPAPASRAPLVSERGHRTLARVAVFLVGCGFAARLLLLDDVHPVVEATGIGLLLAGSGLVLIQCAARGGAAAGPVALLMPLVLAWAARSGEPFALKRAIDVFAACMAGFAVRDLVRRHGLGTEVRRALVTAALVLGVFGCAQTLYLRREAAGIAHEMSHALTMTDLGRAFLDSRRAAATFMSANAFGGFLLLAGVPLGFASLAALCGSGSRAGKARAAVAAAIVLAAFACAGSAGAALAGALGIALAGWLAARGRRRAWLFGALVAVTAIAVALVAVAIGADEPSGKLKTLHERIDYHAAGVRLLRATWPEGAGLEQTRLLTKYVTAGTEAFSRSLHDWWLQGLVEGGVAFLPVAALLLVALVRGVRAAVTPRPPPASAPAPDAAPRGPWRLGVASGVVLALVLQPFVTVLPYGFSHAIVHALVTAAVAALCFSLARRLDLSDPPFAVGLAAGCLAFAIHGFVDYDLYVPGVMATFAVTLGLLLADARPRPARPLARALTLAWGILSLVAPSAIALLAATREHAH